MTTLCLETVAESTDVELHPEVVGAPPHGSTDSLSARIHRSPRSMQPKRSTLLPTTSGSTPNDESSAISIIKRKVVDHYARLVERTYEDCVAGARRLAEAIEALLDHPSEESMSAARQAWLSARIPFLQSEAFRFYDGPIDALDGLINAWPIDESYIDYVAGSWDAGVINQRKEFPIVSEQLIVSLNEKEGEKNISTGFHAIEFLLWGQDFSVRGPGDRPWIDYGPTGRNADRRRAYLRCLSQLLVRHLQTLAVDWNASNPTNYRAGFVAAEPDESLAAILKGLGILSGPELAGERLTVPYETKDQEDEHSCFSDNTHNDVIYDALGIQNVFRGKYRTSAGEWLSGPGLQDLLLKVDPEFAEALAAQIETSLRLARQIPPPFDQAILGPTGAPARVAIKETIVSLLEQSAEIARAAKMLGVKLELESGGKRSDRRKP